MKTVFKIGFLLVAALGYVAWMLWCYNEFGADFTPACLATWAFMVACKLVVGVILFGFWDLSFNDDYGMPISRNLPPPPRRPRIDKQSLQEIGRDTTDVFKYMGHGK